MNQSKNSKINYDRDTLEPFIKIEGYQEEMTRSFYERMNNLTVEANKEQDEIINNNKKGYDVILITHDSVIKSYTNKEYNTFGVMKTISHFDGDSIEEWNNYILKKGSQQEIIDILEEASKEFGGKVPSKKTISRHIKKLIDSDIPLVKIENYNGKAYYKLLNCIEGKYYIRVPYEQMRELITVTNGDMLRLYATVCAILQYNKCGYTEYHPITRKYLAEKLGYSTKTDDALKTIGTMLQALCKLGHLECLEETKISKDGNTYKTIHSYRRTTLAEWQESNNRGKIKK